MTTTNLDNKKTTVISVNWTDYTDYQWNQNLPREGHFHQLRDDIWSVNFGALQAKLREKPLPYEITIDFSNIIWADPLPLLGIATTIRSYVEKSSAILTIKLGNLENKKRGAFLKFITEHHFLSILCPLDSNSNWRIYFEGREISNNLELSALINELIGQDYPLAYRESKCLTARLVPITGTLIKPEERTRQVAEFLNEIRNISLRGIFEERPSLAELALNKLQIILLELINNAIEHAFRKDTVFECYIGLFARIRLRAVGKAEELAWKITRQKEIQACPTTKGFATTHNDDWIELFYYDPGRGLLADLDEWRQQAKKNGETKLLKALNKTKPTANPLQKISKLLFSRSVSRNLREGKPAVTGLQHIGMALSENQDFARTCIGGEWAGTTHPWKKISSSGFDNLRKRNPKVPPIRGTSWHFCIPIRPEAIKPATNWLHYRRLHSEDNVNICLATFPESEFNKWTIIDDRDFDNGPNLSVWPEIDSIQNQALLLPGVVTKQYVFEWIKKAHSSNTDLWVIADLSPHQARIFGEIIIRERWTTSETANKLRIVVACNDWRIAFFELDHQHGHLVTTPACEHWFSEPVGDYLFSLLRAVDSRKFWEGINTTSPEKKDHNIPFVYEKVLWEASDGTKSILYGYIDFAQALVEPRRAIACRRALYRAWQFFTPNTPCHPTDGLLTGLLPDDAPRPETGNYINPTNVSSVLVTGSTASRNRLHGFGTTLHLLRHEHIRLRRRDISMEKRHEPVALEWLQKRPELKKREKGKLAYMRIPGTPFIGRGGAKAIPIRRFDRPSYNKKKKTIEYFQNSLYGENPQETYNHFLRLEILKLGHWRYASHHDLFTVNLDRAYAIESTQRGPLVKWITFQFSSLITKHLATALVYPSHTVTDQIIRDLRKNSPQALPPHIVPIHFLSTHSQSSIRIPSLTYDRIRGICDPEKKPRSVNFILFDDGTITGKVARELEHLLRNAGAKNVYTVTLITRTGLPLYRQLIIDTKNKQRHYWRWDVPAMGDGRSCPLCSAIEQAKLIGNRLSSEKHGRRIDMWVKHWECRKVVTDWEHFGVTPKALPQQRSMTFGKEWGAFGIKKYSVSHLTTTGLAAMVMELIQVTAYKNIGLQIADHPAGTNISVELLDHSTWRRASIEILTGQILLFFDDWDPDELSERLLRLFKFLIVQKKENPSIDSHLAPKSASNSIDSEIHHEDYPEDHIDSLACLVLLLAKSENAQFILKETKDLLSGPGILSHDADLVLGYLLQKNCSDWYSVQKLFNYVDNNGNSTFWRNLAHAWYIYAGREQDPREKHVIALRTIVMLLGDSLATMHCGFFRDRMKDPVCANLNDIRRDLEWLSQALCEIKKDLYISAESLSFDPVEVVRKIDNWIEQISTSTVTASNQKQALIQDLFDYIFGVDGIAQRFHRQFLSDTAGLRRILLTPPTEEKWDNAIKKACNNSDKVSNRWKDSNNKYRYPEIDAILINVPEDIMTVCPPVVRKVIQENVLNVVHSSKPVTQNGDVGTVDMECQIKLEENLIVIRLRSLAEEDCSLPKITQSATSMEWLIEKPVRYSKQKLEKGKIELIAEIRIPTVARIGGI